MSDTRIAKVYAEALYEAASENGKVDAVRASLADFLEAMRGSKELRVFYLDEDFAIEEKKRILLELTEGGDELFRNFLRILVDKRREPVLEEAYRLFVELIEAAAGIIKIDLTTAFPLPVELQQEVKKAIESSLRKTVELRLAVDEEVLGGVKLRIGDRVADASLRNRLDQLRARLVSPTVRLEGSVEAAS